MGTHRQVVRWLGGWVVEPPNHLTTQPPGLSRRDVLRNAGFGIGGLALTYLMSQDGLLAESPPAKAAPRGLEPRQGHFPAQARAMVHFMQNGGPSQMDLFDPKPQLQRRDGQSTPE